MIRSMTGFGNAVAEIGNKTITVEIKSVNSKFFDLSLRLPSAYKDKDLEIRSELSKELERGKVDVSILLDSPDAPKRTSINVPLVKAYYEELKTLTNDLNISKPDYLALILKMPEVLNTDKTTGDEKEWKQLKKTMEEALQSFHSFRKKEGESIEKDMKERVREIEKRLKEIEKLEPERMTGYRKKLTGSLEEFIQSNNIDRNRFEQELIFYIEKIDISEEKVRLRSHCEYFLKTMSEPTSNGKKLAFITQEIGREINTIGSKANDAGMQKLVVEMKDELEKIKEQILNVL
ncbi:MAG: YicC family protein [Bacteroidetes bacterium]|nr:YicC family protein [Bacteroidota bacterium]